jgi:hypothetical protein
MGDPKKSYPTTWVQQLKLSARLFWPEANSFAWWNGTFGVNGCSHSRFCTFLVNCTGDCQHCSLQISQRERERDEGLHQLSLRREFHMRDTPSSRGPSGRHAMIVATIKPQLPRWVPSMLAVPLQWSSVQSRWSSTSRWIPLVLATSTCGSPPTWS